MAAGAKNIATKLAARVRFVKTRTGSSGCSTRRSRVRKIPISATPAAKVAMVSGSPQPSVPARLMP